MISYDFNGNNENSLSLQENSNKPLLRIKGKERDLEWRMFGEHNARNAMAASLAANQYGISIEDSIRSLQKFKGVSKRQDILLDTSKLIIIEDFAHHPTAIKTTIEGVKKNYPEHRLTALIELRSNTMKSGLHDNALAEAVMMADKVHWKSEDHVQIKRLVNSLPDKSTQLDNNEKFISELESMHLKNDIVIIMSNGNFDGLAAALLDRFGND